MGWSFWLLLFVFAWSTLVYQRASINVFTLSTAILLLFLSYFASLSNFSLVVIWSLFLITFIPFRIKAIRYRLISKPILLFYQQIMPSMSRTEKEALTAGTVGFEGELFQGNPDWNKFLKLPKAKLSNEEIKFLEGPVDILCAMINDWEITHRDADLPVKIWNFLKEEGFFSLIIPKEYGGHDFSAYGQSQIFTKIYGCSPSVATTVSVPNSLGPAELLLHYGTDKQKEYYLPRLAAGKDIPCFALTGPDAGSDASAMPDTGIICRGQHEGKEIIGIRLNFNKRYITLAPIATVIGMAFKLYDPEHLISNDEDLGITCALIPRNTKGINIGRRHFPLGVAFQNGPILGKNIFIPIDWIIGGPKMAGQGWRMLMECLAAGRAISLPSASMGGAKMASYTTGAYARIRRQFGVPIGQFEGIQEVLARIASNTYTMDATRSLTASQIDNGESPAVASAITKLHVTELGRKVANDAMDIHGGKAICLGPNNYIGRAWQSNPVAITVEGANILTRCLIVFGQGAMRCHPWIFAELEAAETKDKQISLKLFDKALISHLGYSLGNIVRGILLGWSGGLIAKAPKTKTRKYFRKATRLSAAFALLSDLSLLLLGGSLKRRESLSARLGDILSELYMLSAVLKHYQDQGKHKEDLPIAVLAAQNCLNKASVAFDEIFQNYPSKIWGTIFKFILFPFGVKIAAPRDKLKQKVAKLLLSPTYARSRLTNGTFVTASRGNMIAVVEDALQKAILAEPAIKSLHKDVEQGRVKGVSIDDQAKDAFSKKLISQDELNVILEANKSRAKVINVDDFTTDELTHINYKKDKIVNV